MDKLYYRLDFCLTYVVDITFACLIFLVEVVLTQCPKTRHGLGFFFDYKMYLRVYV